jgi:hypothetical protein
LTPPITAWYMDGLCVRYIGGPWACLPLPLSVEASVSPGVVPGNCTYN